MVDTFEKYKTQYDPEHHYMYKHPTYRLFNFRYDVYVPEIFLYTRQQVEGRGLVVTKDSDIDAGLLNRLLPARIAPSRAAVILSEGGTVNFVNEQEACYAYHDIQMHLKNWLEAMNDPFIREDCPVNGLKMFDALGETLHRLAYINNYGFTVEKTKSSRSALGHRSLNDMLGINNYKHTVKTVREDDITEYPWISNDIEKRMVRDRFGVFGREHMERDGINE